MKKYEKPNYAEMRINLDDIILVSANEGNAIFDETFLDEVL